MSKTINTEEDFLREFVRAVATWKIRSPQLRAALISGKGAELRLEAQHKKAILRVFPQLYPSRKLLARRPGKSEPPYLVASPHFPEELAEDFRTSGINHADLNGRLFIDTEFLLIDREPRTALYRNPVSAPDLFSPKAARIARALLSDRNRHWSQAELTERTGASRGLISRLLKTLIDQGYVLQEARRLRPGVATYRIAEFDRFLDAWRAQDIWARRGEVRQFSLLTNDADEIARTVRDALGEHSGKRSANLPPENAVFTQWFAAHLRHPYATPPVVSAYVSKGRSLPELRFAREVPDGGNLWLITPADEGVFYETQERDGFRLVSDVQIYLDLVQMGQRGPDAAQALRASDGFCQ